MATFNYPTDFTGTGWLVLDGNIYVSSTGSDSAGDGSPANPYATIQQAINAANIYDKIVVGTGNYNEVINGWAKNNSIVADGLVIMQGLPGQTAFSSMATVSDTQSRLEGFYITGYDVAVNYRIATAVNCTFKESRLEDFRGTLQNCILQNISIFATANTYLYNCTLIQVFTSNTLANTKFKEIKDCHIDSQTILNIKSANTDYFDYCNQQPGSNVNIDNLNYSSAAALNTAFPAYQEHGLSNLPLFSFPLTGDYSLLPSSPLLGISSTTSFIGAIGLAKAKIPNILGGSTLINVTINGNGKYELVQGYSIGTIETPEIDLSGKQVLGKVNLFAEEHFETPPYNAVVDKDDSNTQPNKITFELRYSDFPGEVANKTYQEFTWTKQPTVDDNGKGNGSPDFDPLSAIPINTRYVQVRITLQDNTHFLLQENGFVILKEDNDGILI